jgi:hypothetical protein
LFFINLDKQPFSGVGTTLDPSFNKQESVAEEDMSPIFEDLITSLPKEPSVDETDVYTICFKYGDLSFTRRFKGDNTIEVL